MAKKNDLFVFWFKANLSMTPKQKKAFNEWRQELYDLSDKIRDQSRKEKPSESFTQEAECLVKAVCQIPRMED